MTTPSDADREAARKLVDDWYFSEKYGTTPLADEIAIAIAQARAEGEQEAARLRETVRSRMISHDHIHCASGLLPERSCRRCYFCEGRWPHNGPEIHAENDCPAALAAQPASKEAHDA